MTPIHKVWSRSLGLGWQGVVLTGAEMFKTPVSIAWSTFVKHLYPQNVIFPVKITPIHKVWSWSLRGQGVILKELGYPCTQCPFKATLKIGMRNHIKSQHFNLGVKYPCEKCDYSANYRSHLIYHMRSKHEGVLYPYDQCNYKATLKDNLLKHIRTQHEGIKYPFDPC